MEEIKAPKKEKRFLKAVGEVALTLLRDILLNVGKKVINKVGNKRHGLVVAIVILASYFAFAQYPTTGNKQRLGFQTSGDGLVYRGRASDTVSLKSTGLNNAYIIIDTLQNVMYNYIKTKGGWQFNNTDTVIINGATMPFDSVFFKTNIPPNNVDTAKMRWDSELGTVVLGMYDKVPNELGFKNFWLVKNQTGSTITKNSLVYALGTVGSSGRISVSKFIANGTIDAKYLLGITAHDLTDGEDGYVISFGKIRQVNTDTFPAGAILYPSPTTAGVWTDIEPIAPNLDMPVGFCINSSSNNGTIAIRVASGYKLTELHDLAISSPVDRASLYYRGGLWRDTTTALLISDTSSMLTNYLRSGVAASIYQTKLTNPITGTGTTNYLPKFTGTSTLGDANLFTNGNRFVQNEGGDQSFGWDKMISTSSPFFGNNVKAGTGNERIQRVASTTLFNPSAIIFGFQRTNNSSGATSLGGINFMTTSGNPSGDINPIDSSRMFIQPTGNIGIGTMEPSYKFDIRGTLGVTGATTLSNLAGTGTRMVTASSTGLLSTQAIPTGTVTSVTGSSPISSSGGTNPDISMTAAGVNVSGYVTHDGTQIFTGNKSFLGQTTMTGIAFFKDYTYQATRLAGLSSTDRFATVTLGTGLTLSSGVLSAISGVTSVTASTPLSSSGGTIPNITITDAGTGASGVVTTGTQSFAGNKTFTGNVIISGASTLTVGSNGTFGGRVNTPWLERTYTNTTSSSFTVSINTTWLDINTSVLTTLTLPNAATYPGKELHIRQTGGGSLQSASSNIIPFQVPPTGSTSTGILTASTHRAVTLVSDGVNWIIMQRSEI